MRNQMKFRWKKWVKRTRGCSWLSMFDLLTMGTIPAIDFPHRLVFILRCEMRRTSAFVGCAESFCEAHQGGMVSLAEALGTPYDFGYLRRTDYPDMIVLTCRRLPLALKLPAVVFRAENVLMLDCSKRHPSRVFSLLLLLSLLSLAASANAADKPAKPASRDGHPIVAGFERFHAGGADAAKGGRLLLGELNCISCHRPETSQEPRLQRKQAPILDGVGNRVRRSYLRKYLRDPKAIKPGSTMPDLLAGLPEAERGQTIEALVHFLASTGTLRQGRPDIKSIALGKQLFHQVGCVACHGTRDNAGNEAKRLSTSVPLGDLRAKYSLTSLASFLENPHTVRPSGRMPGILTNQEAKQVANYLLQGVGFVDAAQNMTYAYYEGTWDHLPDFTKMKPLATGRAAGFELSVARRPGDFALRFEGYLPIERAGDYRFHLSSDDGSKLFLDDKLVVANDGVHAPSTASGVVKLTKGVHKLGASVFNAGGGVELRVDLEGPG